MTDHLTSIQAALDSNDHATILRLYDALYQQRNRAEQKVDIYLHELSLLEARFKSLTADLPKHEPAAKSTTPKPSAPKPPPPQSAALEIDL